MMQQMLLFLLIGSIYCSKKTAEPTLTYKHEQGEIYVFDNLLNRRLASGMVRYLHLNHNFQYNYPDPHEQTKTTVHEGNLHWRSPIDPKTLIKMKPWGAIRKAVKGLPEHITQEKRYLPYLAYGTMLMRGDHTTAFKGDADHPDSIFARIFLNAGQERNGYSDQTFYDSNDEIVASIHPKVGRIVIWTGSLQTLLRPPSMGTHSTEKSLIVKLNPDETLFKKGCEDFIKAKEIQTSHRTSPFPFTNVSEEFDFDTFNVSEKLLAKYFDKAGNVIAFFDNILPKEMVDTLRAFLTKYEAPFHCDRYDPASSEEHDNIAYLSKYKPNMVLNTPYFTVVRRITEFLSNTTGWHPYDVTCNLIQHTHHTRIHLDCLNGEFEYTFLLYLNHNWTENLYAETSFYELVSSSTERDDNVGSANKEYDFIASVIPKYGRIACFRNLIPHTAKPPAPNFHAARYTFPVKVSESYKQARAKMLMEFLEYKPEDIHEDPLFKNLRHGKYDAYLKDDKRDWVEKQLSMMMEQEKLRAAEEVNRVFSELFPRNSPMYPHRTKTEL